MNRNFVGPWKNSGSSVLSAHSSTDSLCFLNSSLNVSLASFMSGVWASSAWVSGAWASFVWVSGAWASCAKIIGNSRSNARNIIMLFFMS